MENTESRNQAEEAPDDFVDTIHRRRNNQRFHS